MAEKEIMTADDLVEIQVIGLDEEELVEIDSDPAFAALGEPNEQLNHSLLYNRDDPEQHPITSITGLRTELDAIEALQIVYSDKKQQANYYMWRQDIPSDPYGLFVSIYPETDNIYVCDGTSDVFGVTVAEAAFIGGQEYAKAADGIKTGRDGSYGIVVHSGLVAVRRETDVIVGDYVVPNTRGEAKKSSGKYGYLVTALSDVNGDLYAMISLSAPSTIAKDMADSVQDLSGRMSNAEYNITSVANVANSSYALALDAKENANVNSEYIKDLVSEVIDKMDEVDGVIGNLSESIDRAYQNAEYAKAIADSAVNSADIIRTEVVEKANEANENINKLIEKYEPLDEWVDPTTNQIGATYIIEYMNNNGLATKAEVQTVEDKTESNYTAIEQNAKSIQSLASKIDKYAVGEYSQAYGLTLEQAASILEVGYVYIPTLVHNESYSDYAQEFLLGYYYTWSGEKWAPSQSTGVIFSSEYFAGNTTTPYWVVTIADVTKDQIIYDLGGLYKWENGNWTKVASVADNTLSRAVSAIKQTANSITAEVNNVKGDVAALDIRVGKNETSLQTVTTWKGETTSKIATIEQKTGENTNSIALVVSEKDGEKVVNSASIVNAINDGESSVTINADHINFEGFTTFLTADDVGKNGKTTIDGSRIKTGTIDAARLNVEDIIATGTIAVKSDIPTEDEITTITNDTIRTTNVIAENLRVNAANIEGTLTIGKLDSGVQNKINNSIASTKIEYALSDSSTTEPESDWNTVAPEWEDGKYMWQRTTITYTDTSKDDTVTTTCIQGAHGTRGTGILKVTTALTQFPITVDGITTSYRISLNTVKTQAGVSNVLIGDIIQRSYYQYQVLRINDTYVYTGDSTSIRGTAGADGNDGVSVEKVETEYCISTSDTDVPTTGWNNDFDTILEEYHSMKRANQNTTYYIWSREKVTYSSGDPTYSTATVNSASSVIASWCDSNDTTKINGGHIMTGTIDASQITTGTLGSNEYKYTSGNTYTTKGTFFNLNTGELRSPNFSIDSNGDAHYNGELNVDTIQSQDYSEGGIGVWGSGSTSTNVVFSKLSFQKSSDGYYCVYGKADNTEKSTVTNVIIPETHADANGNILPVTSIGDYNNNIHGFNGYKALKHVVIPNSINYINNQAFANCTSLENIYIPNSVTRLGTQVFYVASNLKNVTLSKNLKEIPMSTFSGCKKLTNINIPENIKTIGNTAFNNCSSLTSIIIPKTVTSIGSSAFSGCNNLTIYCEAESQPEGWNSNWNPNNRPVYWYSETQQSGNYWCYQNTKGFKISSKDDSYLIDSQNFKLSHDGLVTATNATIDGNISANKFLSSYSDSTTTTAREKPISSGSIEANANGFDVTCHFGTGRLMGTWKSSVEIETISDQNKKHDIQLQSDVYSDVFDNLQPTTFKYNDGTSDRTHTGLIAQDVEHAVLDAGLTTQDFAAVCYDIDGEGNKTNYGIRYGELVSMCIYEIQKLKKRVEELEDKLNTQQNDLSEK